MVATVQHQQPKTNQTASPKKEAGQKVIPPQANKKAEGADRAKGKTLASAVGDGLKTTAEAAMNASADVAKESIKGGLTSAVINFVGPVRFMIMSNPIGHLGARPLVKYLAPKLEEYLDANKIELPVKPSAILNQVLFGDLEDIDGEVSKALDGFIEKALPEDVKAAFASGSIINITKVTGVSLGSGAKGLASKIFNMPDSNKFTSFFKFTGQKIPFINKLSPKFQPWAAGAGVFMFGGLAVKLVVKFAKLAFKGGILVALAAGGKKIFDRMTKSTGAGMAPGPKAPGGAMGGAMNMLSGLAGGGGMHGMGGAQQSGMGNMINAAMGMLGGRK
jgi:hypothetical protein